MKLDDCRSVIVDYIIGMFDDMSLKKPVYIIVNGNLYNLGCVQDLVDLVYDEDDLCYIRYGFETLGKNNDPEDIENDPFNPKKWTDSYNPKLTMMKKDQVLLGSFAIHDIEIRLEESRQNSMVATSCGKFYKEDSYTKEDAKKIGCLFIEVEQ